MSNQDTNRSATNSGRRRQSAPVRRNNRKSNLVIGILILIILAALAVLAIAWFAFIRPGLQQPQATPAPAVTAEPDPAAEVTSTPEPTPVPTPEPTEEPATSLVFSSASIPVASGEAMATSGAFEGVTFRAPTVAMDGNGREVAVSPDGQSVGAVIPGGYISSLVTLSDGRIGAASWQDNGQKLSILNASADAVEETVDLPSSAVCFADGTGDYSFYYSNGVDLYGYDLATRTAEPLFNWVAAGVNGARISAVTTTDGRTFSCLSNAWREDTLTVETELVTVTGQSGGTTAEATELVLLSVNPLEQLQDEIVSFNRKNPNTRIRLKTFEPDLTESGMIGAIRRFAEAELEGRMPDLYDLTGLPYEAMAASGMLENLSPYLSQDAELQGSVLPQILEGLTVKGGVYGTASGFTLGTVIGPERFLGNMTGWTFDQFTSMTATMGEGTYAFGARDTQSSVLYDVLGMNLHRFINWDNLTCSFTDGGFAKILQFVKKLPAQPRDTNDSEQIQSKVQLLLRTSLYTPADLAELGSDFASPVFIGLPVIDGGGNVISLHRDFAVSSSCTDKDAAWQFARTAFTPPAQSGGWNFPTGREAFEASLSAAGDRAELLRSLVQNAAVNAGEGEVYDLVLKNIQDFLAGKVDAPSASNAVQTAVSAYLESLKQ